MQEEKELCQSLLVDQEHLVPCSSWSFNDFHPSVSAGLAGDFGVCLSRC